MAKAGPEGLITALDIGSSKVSAMIAQKGDGGELIVLGTGQRESRGVKRGYIADMAATEAAVREAVEQAERIAGINIENVWVGFSAGGLVSDVAEVEFELGGHRVEQQDIDALLAAGRNSIDPQGRMVLHAQPQPNKAAGGGGVAWRNRAGLGGDSRLGANGYERIPGNAVRCVEPGCRPGRSGPGVRRDDRARHAAARGHLTA